MALVLSLGACAPVLPGGPSYLVGPPPGKDVRAFQTEEGWCRRHSAYAVAYDPAPAYVAARANQASAASIVGGAALGALAGSLAGRAGAGALIGAAYGLALGGAAAANGAGAAATRMQNVYDATYLQCMSSYGNLPPPVFMPVY